MMLVYICSPVNHPDASGIIRAVNCGLINGVTACAYRVELSNITSVMVQVEEPAPTYAINATVPLESYKDGYKIWSCSANCRDTRPTGFVLLYVFTAITGVAILCVLWDYLRVYIVRPDHIESTLVQHV